MIVKVQRPLNDPSAEMMVYPRGRHPTWLLPQTRELRQALGEDPKGYFEAEVVGDTVRIGRRVEAQAW